MEARIESDVEPEANSSRSGAEFIGSSNSGKIKDKDSEKDGSTITNKRRCVSTACVACRRRKSKCDGNLPKCAACASVYLTECEYAPHTDHRRKGVYKKEADSTKTKSSTLQTLIHALLNYDEVAAHDLLRQIRSCDNLEELSHAIDSRDKGADLNIVDSPIYAHDDVYVPQFEAQLSSKMGDLVVDGSIRFIGGTSNLIWLNNQEATSPAAASSPREDLRPDEESILRWTKVTADRDQILHLMNMYFCWHYAYFTTLSKQLFYRDFLSGIDSQYCSSLLVNVMLTLGCHFSSEPDARADPTDSSTTGDHFFAEAKRLLHENDEFATPKLCTVQALALMSVREAGCGRESKGWVYSGMSFRMASDLGLNVDIEPTGHTRKLTDDEIDARSITFWGCFFFDKCWSNYLGRQPQLLLTNTNVKKPDVFPSEESELWAPYTDSGIISSHNQPARTRAVALQIFKLAEISSDLLTAFYQPQNLEKPIGKQAELKKLTDIHTRLEAWKKELPVELDPKEWQLPHVLLMHMFYQLLYIHLYRPFLKYTKATSPLPAHISPRKFCTSAAAAISKLFRLYKRTHGLRQICNIAVYIAHSACTIHLLNLPDKNAKRDIIHGVKHLEEIGEFWTCARRTLRILQHCAEEWGISLPEETQVTFMRTRQRWGSAEPSPTPLSPDTIVDLTQHLDSQPITDTMARNLQMQRHLPQSAVINPVSVQPTTLTTSSSPSNALYSNPQNGSTSVNQEVNAGRGVSQLRAMAQLTRAQQEAWNAHQAKMISHTGQANISTRNDQKNAAVLFGGVDSLMEESQDWWLHDQSQLALGFDNWNSPATDWPPSSNATGFPALPDSHMTSPTGSTGYPSTDMVPDAYGSIPVVNRQMDFMTPTKPPPQGTFTNSMSATTVQDTSGNSRKRISPYEQDGMFY